MITYNFVILDVNKTISPFLNLLDENKFLEEYDKDRALGFVLNKIEEHYGKSL